jgi:hypothetical protein
MTVIGRALLDGRMRPSPHARRPGLGRLLLEVGALYSAICVLV